MKAIRILDRPSIIHLIHISFLIAITINCVVCQILTDWSTDSPNEISLMTPRQNKNQQYRQPLISPESDQNGSALSSTGWSIWFLIAIVGTLLISAVVLATCCMYNHHNNKSPSRKNAVVTSPTSHSTPNSPLSGTVGSDDVFVDCELNDKQSSTCCRSFASSCGDHFCQPNSQTTRSSAAATYFGQESASAAVVLTSSPSLSPLASPVVKQSAAQPPPGGGSPSIFHRRRAVPPPLLVGTADSTNPPFDLQPIRIQPTLSLQSLSLAPPTKPSSTSYLANRRLGKLHSLPPSCGEEHPVGGMMAIDSLQQSSTPVDPQGYFRMLVEGGEVILPPGGLRPSSGDPSTQSPTLNCSIALGGGDGSSVSNRQSLDSPDSLAVPIVVTSDSTKTNTRAGSTTAGKLVFSHSASSQDDSYHQQPHPLLYHHHAPLTHYPSTETEPALVSSPRCFDCGHPTPNTEPALVADNGEAAVMACHRCLQVSDAHRQPTGCLWRRKSSTKPLLSDSSVRRPIKPLSRAQLLALTRPLLPASSSSTSSLQDHQSAIGIASEEASSSSDQPGPSTLFEEFWNLQMNYTNPKDYLNSIHGVGHKNRYPSIWPNPATRVVLPMQNNDLATTYINANYISGYKLQPGAFIATQGPLANTVDDFWRMIWLTKSPAIVMITKLFEKRETKCELYLPNQQKAPSSKTVDDNQPDAVDDWQMSTSPYSAESTIIKPVITAQLSAEPVSPPSSAVRLASQSSRVTASTSSQDSCGIGLAGPGCSGFYVDGELEVRIIDLIDRPGFVQRRLLLRCHGQERIVNHFWYTAWPDNSSPESTTTSDSNAAHQLLTLVREVEACRQTVESTSSSSSISSGDNLRQPSRPSSREAMATGGDDDSDDTAARQQRRSDEQAATNPIVVHCSAGIGRTGCFIALCIGCKQLAEEGCVDVLGIVKRLRLERGGMIQTNDQYEFIHQALAAFLPPDDSDDAANATGSKRS